MTLAHALSRAYGKLRAAGVPDFRHDAQWLLAELFQVKRLGLTLMQDTPLDEAREAAFEALIARRAAREPLQYLLGSADFMGHRLSVRPGVLIPRNDTETLAQMAIRRVKPGDRVLDLCCGSGCLAIAVKMACPGASVWASDLMQEAVSLTGKTRRASGPASPSPGGLFQPLRGQRFELIISNPPYIPSDELPRLQAEVRFEPAAALDGGADGLSFYHAILARAPGFLSPGGWLMVEIGDGQAETLPSLLPAGFEPWRIVSDLSGLPRAAETRLIN